MIGHYHKEVVPSAAKSVESSSGPVDFESVYDQCFSFVWRMARRFGVAEESLDDVSQEVFFIVHKRLETFAGQSSLKTWVFGILYNVVLSHRRTLSRKSPAHRSVAPPVDPTTVADSAAGPYEHASTSEAARIARQLLDSMDEDKRTILVLVELEEMSVAEVAVVMGVNLNTAHARLRAARKQFTQVVTRYRAREQWRVR